MAITVAGIDLSIRRTGIAKPDGTLASVSPPAHLDGYRRHWWIAEQVAVHVAGADVAMIEGYALGFGSKMPNTLAALAEIGGVVRTMLTRQGRTLVILPPARLKAFAVGKGNATKDEMLEAAQILTADQAPDRRPSNHDEADAYWLRRAGVSRYVLGVTPVALESVEWPAVTAVGS